VEFRKVADAELVKACDMTQDMQTEVVEIVTGAIEKQRASENYEVRIVGLAGECQYKSH